VGSQHPGGTGEPILGTVVEAESSALFNSRHSLNRQLLFLAFALINFLLIALLPTTYAQVSTSASESSTAEATVSVQELQIPAKARSALEQGVERLRKGDAARSLFYFQRAIRECPTYHEAYCQKGLAEVRLGQVSEAVQSFQKAIDLSGGHYALAYFGYGQALARLGKLEDAEAILRRGLEQDPASAEGYTALSLVLVDEHHLDEAENIAQKALQLPDPNAWKARLALACVRVNKRQYRAAVDHLEDFLQHLRSQGDRDLIPRVERELTEVKARAANQSQTAAR
jgi:tetratricopeptide (TPR) repeat protein